MAVTVAHKQWTRAKQARLIYPPRPVYVGVEYNIAHDALPVVGAAAESPSSTLMETRIDNNAYDKDKEQRTHRHDECAAFDKVYEWMKKPKKRSKVEKLPLFTRLRERLPHRSHKQLIEHYWHSKETVRKVSA